MRRYNPVTDSQELQEAKHFSHMCHLFDAGYLPVHLDIQLDRIHKANVDEQLKVNDPIYKLQEIMTRLNCEAIEALEIYKVIQ